MKITSKDRDLTHKIVSKIYEETREKGYVPKPVLEWLDGLLACHREVGRKEEQRLIKKRIPDAWILLANIHR